MGNRILIVEDDRSFASQVKEIVDKHGHTALIAATGPEGVEMYTRHEPDLLIVDVMLPGMTGIQVIEKVRQLQGGSDVPILLMSAMYRSAEFFKEDLQRLRLLDFLAKPFSLIDFGRRIDGIFEKPEKGRAQVRAMSPETGTATTPEEQPESSPSVADQRAAPQATDSAQVPATSEAMQTPAGQAKTTTSVPRKSHPRISVEQGLSRSDGHPFETDSLTPDRYVQLISTLFHSHSSGRFDLLELGSVRSIYFLNGYAVWIDVPNILDGLPRYLAQESLLSLSQMARLAEIAESNGKDLRGALSQLQLIPDEELSPIFEAWISSELQKGLNHRGAARFERSEGFTQPVRIQEINPIQALWQGVYRISDDDWFESELSDLDGRSLGRTRSFSKLFGYLGRDHRLQGVAEALREPKTSEEFLARMDDERGLGTRALWFMVYSGLVSFSDPHPGHAKAKSPTAAPTSKAKATSTPPRPQPTPATKPAVVRPSAAEQQASKQSTPSPRASTPDKPVSSSPVSSSPVSPAQELPPKLPEPEEKHVFFEPSRKKSQKPKAQDERSPEEIVRLDFLEKMDLNHYGFLEIEQGATNNEIEEAYSRLAPPYRPRNLGTDAPEEEKQMARKLLARLVSAHEELSDPKRRARYDLSEASRKPGKRGESTNSEETWDDEDSGIPSSPSSERGESADGPWYPGQHDPSQVHSRMGELDSEDADNLLQANLEMQRGDFKHAFARLDELRSFDPSNSFVLADLGWCQFSMRPNDAREIEKALEWVDLALTFDPTHRNSLEVKARILVSLEDPDVEVDVTLRNLLKVVPSHAWAKREFQAAEERKEQAQPKKKRGLRGLVDRKKKSGSNKKGEDEGL
jgi:DNA-binding response OmpR family regulator/curved DNA-binding protein CbpA